MKENILIDKSIDFAARIINLQRYLVKDKKEALSLLQAKGFQLPSSLPQDGFVHSIRKKNANINLKFGNVTQTQQFKRWFTKSNVVNLEVLLRKTMILNFILIFEFSSGI